MPMSFGGHAASSSGCAIGPREHEIGLTGSAGRTRISSLTGSYAMATAEHREPCESRGSSKVLGAPGGEIPPGDSTSRTSAVPDFVGHWQAGPGGGIDRPLGQDLKLILEDPHQLTCVLARVPCGPLQKFVAADVAVIDVGATGPIGPCLPGLPPGRETSANILAVRQNFLTRRTGRGHPIVRRRLQWNAIFVLEEGIDDVEQMPSQLRIGARSARKLVVQMIVGYLSEKARRPIDDNVNAPHQLSRWQVANDAQIDADQSRNFLE